MSLILNIGLARNGKSNIGVGTVLRDLASYFTVLQHSVQHSETEITVVAEVERRGNILNTANAIFILAELLGQECIAVYNCSSAQGALIGPRADKWGDFNPEYFVMLDGRRMNQPALQVAA